MWPKRSHIPLQLARSALGGILLSLSTLAVVALLPRSGFPWMHPTSAGWSGWCVRWLAGLLLLLPGIVLEMRALSVLNEGARLHRWRDHEIESLRVSVEKPVWRVLGWSSLLVMALLLMLLPRHSIFSGAWCFVWIPMGLLHELRTLKKPNSQALSILDRFRGKPLQSEHWGQRIS